MIRYNDHWMLKAGSMIMILGILGCASEKTNYTSALNVSTTMGKQVRIKRYMEHDIFCAPSMPTIIVTTLPAHGTFSTRQETGPAGVTRVGSVDCSGRILPGLALYYTPEPGFRGSDQMKYTVGITGRALHDSAAITVK